jgi:hypothetical protein
MRMTSLIASRRDKLCDRRKIMGHRLDVGDVIDMLEESAMMRRPVVVKLHDGRIFEDRVREIVKWQVRTTSYFTTTSSRGLVRSPTSSAAIRPS